MRTLFLLLMFAPLLSLSQNKNVVNANRVFPKVDKALEFEKALATHAQKYHTGDFRWRVFEIQSGPDAGGYHITEGPTSWEALDGRGNLGTEHNTDWNKSVAIYLTDRGSSSYAVFQDSLSTVAIGDYADKIQITHITPKIGWFGKVWNAIEKFKPVWEAGAESIAIYTSSGSGPAQFNVVTRYKQGLKERSAGFRKPLKSRYEAVHGSDSWEDWLEVLRKYVDYQWAEMLSIRPDLGSK
ncbi:MAG TPA: hypothetical protein VFN30_10020 [Chitinophagaceae bacterium]|nr:hypothetical protein [Chitinophagaceae bacterium]